MRPTPRRVPFLLAVSLTVAAIAVPSSTEASASRKPPAPFGSGCRTSVKGSEVAVYCHNPYVPADRVALHIECSRWWDLDVDSAAVEVDPAQTVRLTGRCWKEVRAVWVSHQRVR
ncbi:hypothetical protein [Streptomyces sp. NBC_00344]|uniref:hypothetical protein n=1 Tax=Streptomyces sp. NBC_00344 TaxID=2975720 RepID=UPI002E1F5B4C